MTLLTDIVLITIGLVTGGLIGTVGIGGVLLVPALVFIGGLSVHEATPIATQSFLFTGIAGTVAYSRQRRIQWPTTKWLLIAVIPGAIAGASANVALSATAITIVIATMLGAAAISAFRDPTGAASLKEHSMGVTTLVVAGVLAGFGSTLSGTGGPVLLIPIMLLAGATVGTAVSTSQPIQIPIAIFGSVSFLAYGALNWQLALVLGVAQGIGAVAGARFSSRLPKKTLRVLVAWALAVSAAMFMAKVIAG